ncbi:MAG TPA: DoxX family protein [Geminicoccus sp.]|uniref:DoxX family protein n=1 Tax=Geminicoccus sp. TaxID=2024832 RepID=UPI002C19876A|nr:DoxX family protein [Geminicoccus sp.]HWL68942.1 DoxX family protein [Geminicoccus sp.]
MPRAIEVILGNQWFGYLARAVLTSMFWMSGLAKLLDFSGGVAEMSHFGLEPAVAYNTVVLLVQLAGSALIILNRWTWLGAGMLAVFTLLTIPIAHHFWTMEEPFRTLEFYVVMEHITVVGALMVVAWASTLERAPARPALQDGPIEPSLSRRQRAEVEQAGLA